LLLLSLFFSFNDNQEEEEERLRQERIKKEEQEYQEWKALISVETSGTEEAERIKRESRIGELIEHIQVSKFSFFFSVFRLNIFFHFFLLLSSFSCRTKKLSSWRIWPLNLE
jgi:hypothetical protein